MKPKHAIWALCSHAALLLLASTRFSAVSWMWGKWAWTWDYFHYSYQNGWGYQYQSEYSAVVVVTYLAAFSAGMFSYVMAGRRIAGVWSTPAIILCVLGLISFLIEGSHWLWDHHVSWIAICPAASLLLAGIGAVQLGKRAEPKHAADGSQPFRSAAIRASAAAGSHR